MADKIVEMAPRTIDASAVQKDSVGKDQLMAKIATLEGQIASLKLQRKFRSPSPHHHQRCRSRSKSRRRYNPQGRYCFYHFRFGKNCLPGKCASPLHLVNKKDGTLRPCGDYRQLNALTVPDRYPIPRIEDFNYTLKDNLFSKIDLVKEYYQIPIAEEDKEKTATTTSFGLHEFNTMSFGLKNAPSTFQRFITEVLYGLEFVFPYLLMLPHL
ncbi:hypothetical protein TNCV_1347661 [Trichonephila clavipes]|nr:hypothetical protein TNCV_1347661 [Trichonephila clavipes]